jgi:hypothetical protein
MLLHRRTCRDQAQTVPPYQAVGPCAEASAASLSIEHAKQRSITIEWAMGKHNVTVGVCMSHSHKHTVTYTRNCESLVRVLA